MRALGFLLPLLLACNADAAAVASGRNWRLAIDSIECAAGSPVITVGTRIDYLGPKGPVEAPIARLVDAGGKASPPRSLVWKGGEKKLARWLPSTGIATVSAEHVADVQLRFEVRDAKGDLSLEFGDIRAFALTRKRTEGCQGLLKPAQLKVPAAARAGPPESSKLKIRVYRSAYPCVPKDEPLRRIEADQPPHLPRQLLLLGRGFLPSAREIDLPMGRAAAQPYLYPGADSVDAVEEAARQAILGDFPEYRSGLVRMSADGRSYPGKYFAFNWGTQKWRGGNEVYSIGIYELLRCSAKER